MSETGPKDPNVLRGAFRITLRKFDGDDQTKEPVETIVIEDDDFKRFAGLPEEEKKDATD